MSDTLPIRRIGPAYEQVAEALRALILAGHVSPGQRLPPESELSGAFGVSRSTIREALRVLSSQHLLTIMRGAQGGTFIAAPTPDSISNYLETSLALMAAAEEVEVDQLLETREALEVPAAAAAAERRSDDDLEALRTSMKAGRDGDQLFHEIILRAARNPLLELISQPVFHVLHDRFLRDRAPQSFWRQVHRDHDGLFLAIEAENADAAAILMRQHLRRLAATYRRIDKKRLLPTTSGLPSKHEGLGVGDQVGL